MQALVWLVRAFIFFTLFAFALNNQHTVVVHWFFGVEWRTPMVIVVLAAFSTGCAIGVLAMVPRWWQRRRETNRLAATPAVAPPAPRPSATPSGFGAEHPPREGL